MGSTETGLHKLEAEVSVCRRCSLSGGRIQAVPGSGNLRALVMFVGEGPGAAEDKLGLPFVGRSGKFLDQMLAGIGLSRQDVYITNVVKCRPPANRDPFPAELNACADYLTRQIDLIDPRIIVTLGRFSMARWFPQAKISQIHGQAKEIEGGRMVMAMFHPAAALRNPTWRAAFEQDMKRLTGLIQEAKKSLNLPIAQSLPKRLGD